MKLIQANCRIQFTAEDVKFITETLGRKSGGQGVLVDLLSDPDTRDLILDQEDLYHAILERRGCLRISSRLYFFVIVRQVLKQAGIQNRQVADYTAELLAEYSELERTRCRLPGEPHALEYFFEMLAALSTADDRRAFFIRAHIGNHSLFFSGVFPKRIRQRAERKGFPDLGYFESMGQASFKIASDHRLAARYDLAPIYSTLADRFHDTREALNEMSERLVSVDDPDDGLDGLLLKAFQPAI